MNKAKFKKFLKETRNHIEKCGETEFTHIKKKDKWVILDNAIGLLADNDNDNVDYDQCDGETSLSISDYDMFFTSRMYGWANFNDFRVDITEMYIDSEQVTFEVIDAMLESLL